MRKSRPFRSLRRKQPTICLRRRDYWRWTSTRHPIPIGSIIRREQLPMVLPTYEIHHAWEAIRTYDCVYKTQFVRFRREHRKPNNQRRLDYQYRRRQIGMEHARAEF